MEHVASPLSPPPSADTSGSFDDRMVARTRLILASSALLIIYIDPAEPNRFIALTYATLLLYTGYSAILYLLALRRSRIFQWIEPWAHWFDLCWYTALIALSNGTNSLFFFGFFFSILIASFRFGFESGLLVTITSAIIFTIVGVATFPAETPFELNRFLLRPTYLLVFGYIIARRGGFEIRLRRRLTLLKDISQLSNPRLGVDRTITSIMARVRAFFLADACVLALKDSASSGYTLLYITEVEMRKDTLTADQSQRLIVAPNDLVIAYQSRPRCWRRWRSNYYAYDPVKNQRTMVGEAESGKLAGMFDTESFISAPLNYHHETIGRIYLTARRRFDGSDARFLLQVMEHVLPVIDNIRLVDQLASNAAEEERRRIARDIHDSVIQPYIGLQIGLTALRRKLAAGEPDALDAAEKLTELTEAGIADLRGYISGLKETGDRHEGLLPAARRFAARFAEVTGIAVEIKAETEIRLADRLAAEVFQMIAEGLSNVRRHTHSNRAAVKLSCNRDIFTLQIENESDPGVAFSPFTPRSITERAESLGGRARVQQTGGCVQVIVEIPL